MSSQTLLLVAIAVCLVLIVQPDVVASLTRRVSPVPKRVLSQAEMQLFTTTSLSGEIVMVGAQGVLIDQGSQAVRVGTAGVSTLTGGEERLTIDSNGKFSLNSKAITVFTGAVASRPAFGTSVGATEIRSLTAPGADTGFLRLAAGGANTGSGASSYIDLSGSGSGEMDKNIVFATNGAERMRVLSNGNVGIGTNNPGSKLHVQGGNINCTNTSTILMDVSSANPNLSVSSASGGTSSVYLNGGVNAGIFHYAGQCAPNINPVTRLTIGANFYQRDCSWFNTGCSIGFLDMNTNGDYPTEVRGGAITFNTINVAPNDVNISPTERMRIQPWGNVGIGTGNPLSNLHVFSTSTGHPSVLRLTSTVSSYGSSANGARLEFNTYATSNGTSYFQSAIQGIDDVSNDSGYGGLAFLTYNNTSLIEAMRITSRGNVGIGTNNPQYALDVYRHFRVVGHFTSDLVSDNIFFRVQAEDSYNGDGSRWVYSQSIDLKAGDLTWANGGSRSHGAGIYIGGGASDRGAINHGAIDFKTAGATRMTVAGNGNVGIGIVNPSHRLHVNANGIETAFKLSRYDTPFNNYIHFEYEHWLGLAGYRSRISSAHVGDGRTDLYFYTATSAGLNHRFSVEWSGNAWLAGGLVQSSDLTLKKNIELLPYGLQTIQSLNPVQYHFKDQEDSSKKRFGLIAQEVRDILPQLIGEGPDGKLSLSYIELVPILINAVKEQQQIISQQQSTISSLSDRLARLEALLSR